MSMDLSSLVLKREGKAMYKFNDDIPAEEAVALIRAVERYANARCETGKINISEVFAILGIEEVEEKTVKNKKAKELVVGDVIRIEYGDYDNFVNFEVDEVINKGNKTEVRCHKARVENMFCFDAEQEMECM